MSDDEQKQVEAGEQAGEDAPVIAESSEHTPGDDQASDELRERLVEMRAEADRIASLETGDEQVEAAERFAEAAGRLDEQVGAAARDADDDRNA